MVLNLRVKQVLMALGGIVGVFLLGAGYYAYQLTRHEDTGLQVGINIPDGNEATRKLKLLADSQANGKRGFVRFSAIEINSFLQAQYNLISLTNEPPAPAVTLNSFVGLTPHNIIWASVVRRTILGRPIQFLWERTVALARDKDKWIFPVKAMRVGEVDIPQRLWPTVENFFSGADDKYASRIEWGSHLPALELTTNELSLQPELRAYNYAPLAAGKK
jgi:hypothetical protein